MKIQYSIAIRTLGTTGDVFRKELESLHRQTVPPEHIIIYIAEGHERPQWQVGIEEYVWVKKGMVAQRALQYRECPTPWLLLLDDDVILAPDTVEKMMAVARKGYDIVGEDTFRNHEMSTAMKVFAAITNWTLPHRDHHWAFTIHPWMAFSYLMNPSVLPEGYAPTQYCAGCVTLWRKDRWLSLHQEDELWMDKAAPFAYMDDTLQTYKAYKAGIPMAMLFNGGTTLLDARSGSQAYHRSILKYWYRSKMQWLVWHQLFSLRQPSSYLFILKQIYLLPMLLIGTAVQVLLRLTRKYEKGGA